MSFFQWRRFNFFEISKDVDSGHLSRELGEENAVTCASSGRGSIVLGDLKVNTPVSQAGAPWSKLVIRWS